jgi:hypothetical protein
MPSTFPGTLDNFTDPLSNSALNSPSHAGQHQDLNDAVEKIETYMGLVKVIPTSATNGTVSATGTVTVGSAVSSVTVSGCFSSLYDNYRIIYAGGIGSSSGTDIKMTLGATATGYYYGIVYNTYASATPAGLSAQNTTSWPYVGTISGNNTLANVDLLNPNLAKYTTVSCLYVASSTSGAAGAFNGLLADTTQYTAFTFTPTAGTITGGTIRVYGYRN